MEGKKERPHPQIDRNERTFIELILYEFYFNFNNNGWILHMHKFKKGRIQITYKER